MHAGQELGIGKGAVKEGSMWINLNFYLFPAALVTDTYQMNVNIFVQGTTYYHITLYTNEGGS